MLNRDDVRLKGLQHCRRWVPVLAVDVAKRVAMHAGSIGYTSGGDALMFEGGASAFDKVCDHIWDKSILRYALQDHNHTAMCAEGFTRRRMEKTPDDRRSILRDFIKERGLRIARWAKESGVDKNSIYNFLNGHSNALDPRTYAKLARTVEVPVWRISGEQPEPPSPTAIWVSGSVEAGAFKEAVEWDRSRWYSVDVPVPDRFRRKAKALEVRGSSMNLEYRPGSVVIWVDMLDYRAPRHEDHVIVYSHSVDGRIEATVKELRVDSDGRQWLWPRSSEPEHQQPLNIDSPPSEVKTIEIKGIVIGDYRPRAV